MEEKLHNIYNKEYTEEEIKKITGYIDYLYNKHIEDRKVELSFGIDIYEKFKEEINELFNEDNLVVATGKGGAINYLKSLHKQLGIVNNDEYYNELIKDGTYLITNKGLERI